MLTKLFGLVYDIQYHVRGSTLDATIKLLCAAVRGISQRKDPFVLELQVADEQVSRLVEFEEIARNKCAMTVKKRKCEGGIFMMKETITTVLQLKQH